MTTITDESKACAWCCGRGWNVGDCHPQEECGGCDGTGRVTAVRHGLQLIEIARAYHIRKAALGD